MSLCLVSYFSVSAVGMVIVAIIVSFKMCILMTRYSNNNNRFLRVTFEWVIWDLTFSVNMPEWTVSRVHYHGKIIKNPYEIRLKLQFYLPIASILIWQSFWYLAQGKAECTVQYFRIRWPKFSTDFGWIFCSVTDPWVCCNLHGTTLIRTRISNRMPSKVWDEITYPFPTVKIIPFNFGNVSNVIPNNLKYVTNFPCWG